MKETLKIKDNIDLKELEKYGFKETLKDTYFIEKNYENNGENEFFNKYKVQFIVNPMDSKIKNELVGCFNAKNDGIDETFDLDILYDLIKNNIVEKIEKR